MQRRRILPFTVIALVIAGLPAARVALAQDGDAVRGADDDRRPRQRGPGQRQPAEVDPANDEVLQTIKAAVEPDDTQWQQIIDRYRQLRRDQFRLMREAMQSMRDRGVERGQDPPDREQMRELRRSMREKMAAQLQPINATFLADCKALLQSGQIEAWDGCASELELMPRRRGRGGGPGGRGGRAETGPAVGDVSPAFELTDLEGRTVSLASLRGKPVVVEFGSYTCPVFRRQVDGVEALRREFGAQVHWVLIYTREAHPTDGWVVALNTRQGIVIPQHTSFEKRLESARLCHEKMDLKLTVLVDTLDNKVAEAYSGHPNHGYVIDAEGRIVSRQAWIDPQRTRDALTTLIGGRATGATKPPAG